jgi:hypothetical protein
MYQKTLETLQPQELEFKTTARFSALFSASLIDHTAAASGLRFAAKAGSPPSK